MQYQGLDHLAIAVADTEEALKVWRDKFGFQVLFREKVNHETVLLTHLDLGNTQLQLVEPLVASSPLYEQVRKQGPVLHHFCLKVDDITEAFEATTRQGLPPGEPQPHQGTQGKRALFLDKAATDSILVELTGK